MCGLAKLRPREEEAVGAEEKESKAITEWVDFLLRTAQGSMAKRKARKWKHTGKALEGSPKEQIVPQNSERNLARYPPCVM